MNTCIICASESNRKKYEVWYKKFLVCEGLQMEFEILASASPAKAQTFLDELDEKVAQMTQFKKTWLKFTMQTDTYVKKDVILLLARVAFVWATTRICVVVVLQLLTDLRCNSHINTRGRLI